MWQFAALLLVLPRPTISSKVANHCSPLLASKIITGGGSTLSQPKMTRLFLFIVFTIRLEAGICLEDLYLVSCNIIHYQHL
ncbi:hypothetical protein GDO86_012563 [Hymenochirus boettgeri]|uniref:Secreted protein n=1 Tax=Hymenochirus boettgeri TaxID=247094 RepID=A0A8T2IT52_9PIPI|nr:hypothetical protein GDO86_012563 [Hymenochirus boettgeri]